MQREIIWVTVNSSKQVTAACSHALTLHSCVMLMHTPPCSFPFAHRSCAISSSIFPFKESEMGAELWQFVGTRGMHQQMPRHSVGGEGGPVGSLIQFFPNLLFWCLTAQMSFSWLSKQDLMLENHNGPASLAHWCCVHCVCSCLLHVHTSQTVQ